jgi:branched-chain amino acid transport system permease protein
VRERLQSLFRANSSPSQRAQGGTFIWILSCTASTLLLMGWLLPWFVTDYSAGAGFSAQDALVSPPTGIGTVLIYVLAATMLFLVLSPLADAAARIRGRSLGPRVDRARLIAGLLGLALTAVVWLLIRVVQEEPLFGPITTGTTTDSAVWLMMYGYALAAFVYGARTWVLNRPSFAFVAAALPFGLFLPLMFHQAPVFLDWAAAFLAIYMLLALGLNVVVGFAGLLDLGYAAFFAIGAYATASLASPIHNVHMPLWVLIFVGAAVASSFGAILGAPTLRLRGDYLAIVTLGFGEIIPDLATNNVFNLTGGPNGISGIDQPKFGFIDFGQSPRWYYWSLLLVVIAVVILLRNIEHSRVGRAWVALREDEVAAAATGINTTTTKLLAFAIGASVSGLAGAFYAYEVSIVSPDDFSFSVSIAVLSIVVLGGIGNIAGVILGSFILTFVIFWALPNVKEWSTTLSQTIHVPALANINFSSYTFIIYGAALILMMLLRPGGLLPSQARRIELESTDEGESLAAVQGIA